MKIVNLTKPQFLHQNKFKNPQMTIKTKRRIERETRKTRSEFDNLYFFCLIKTNFKS